MHTLCLSRIWQIKQFAARRARFCSTRANLGKNFPWIFVSLVFVNAPLADDFTDQEVISADILQ